MFTTLMVTNSSIRDSHVFVSRSEADITDEFLMKYEKKSNVHRMYRYIIRRRITRYFSPLALWQNDTLTSRTSS